MNDRDSLIAAHDRFWAITEEMTGRAQDPRCPRPLALLLVAWVNALNTAMAEVLEAKS